jgi:K+/H+ antiporter YhaU regulatory subunit KhtT
VVEGWEAMSDRPKLYAERDIMEMGQGYFEHVLAMTAEGLHDKSDIAAELAWRDEQIAALQQHLAEREALLQRAHDVLDRSIGDTQVWDGARHDVIAAIDAALAPLDGKEQV